MRTSLVRITLALAVAAGLAACSKNKKPVISGGQDGPARTGTRTGAPGTATVTPVGKDAGDAPRLSPIYFAFDSVTLSAEARSELDTLGTWMQKHESRVLIEGHADERGTTEYNVALGQRRAQAIADYLAHLGVASKRLDTISYGEERPASAGSDETAYAQNRRGEIRKQ